MARNHSFMKLEGSLDNLTFYQMNGQSLVKKQSYISRNRILNDPAFKRTRENMSEFGGAAQIGKAFRDSLSTVPKSFSDSYMGARVNAVMKRMSRLGLGLRGEREFDVVTYGFFLRDFEFNISTPFSAQFRAPQNPPTVNVARDTVEWTVPDFDTDSFITVPEGATHFRLVLAAGYVSDYAYKAELLRYAPVDDAVNARGGADYSGYIAVGGMVGATTTLQLDFSALGTIPATSAVFGCRGIVFYQEVNSQYYELATGNAMRVATVG